ncbi:MAG: hypothetical protein Q8S02_08425 [Hydrogenophaga sp.]|nr:hypothetical protein [Hydrogenophaga sp.]
MGKINKLRRQPEQTDAIKCREASGKIGVKSVGAHRRAINRIKMELMAGEGLMARFHGPVEWRCVKYLVMPRQSVKVQVETAVRLDGRRYVPDLLVRCPLTDQILVAIEVWETHAVSTHKRVAYQAAGIPWIEVRAYKAYARFRRRPLSVLDWGGIADVESPCQYALFAAEPQAHPAKVMHDRTSHRFSVRSRDWQLPPPLLLGLDDRLRS